MCVPSSAVCFMSRFLLVLIGWLGDVTLYSPRALCFVVVWNYFLRVVRSRVLERFSEFLSVVLRAFRCV